MGAPIPMTAVTDKKVREFGDFYFTWDKKWIHFKYRDFNGGFGYATLRTHGPGDPCALDTCEEKQRGRACWSWDGDEDKPTLDPSIVSTENSQRGGRETWHGWVKAGVLADN